MARERIHHPENDNIYAEVMADSLSPNGDRLTTLQVQCHRFVLAEFNTHRRFSRNSASSRAIPARKQIDRVLSNPAIPLVFPAEQKGMQGGDPLSVEHQERARELWLDAMRNAVTSAIDLNALKVHKSVVNRILEPFMWHTIIVSATEWQNFFTQRCSPLAQPEIRAVAECMQLAMKNSEPFILERDEWHLPYITDEDRAEVCDRSGFIGTVDGPSEYPWQGLARISSARCARVSYLTQEGKRDIEVDLELYQRLTEADPPHWSPLEHVAKPAPWEGHPAEGNFTGWVQLRGLVEQERLAA